MSPCTCQFLKWPAFFKHLQSKNLLYRVVDLFCKHWKCHYLLWHERTSGPVWCRMKPIALKLKRLMLFRVSFCFIAAWFYLCCSSKRSCIGLPGSPISNFYGLSIFICVCSLAYIAVISPGKKSCQVRIYSDRTRYTDHNNISLLSGGFASFYSFLYPSLPIIFKRVSP